MQLLCCKTTWKNTSFPTMRILAMRLLGRMILVKITARMLRTAAMTGMMTSGPHSAETRTATGLAQRVADKEVEEGLVVARLMLRQGVEEARVAIRDATVQKRLMDAVVASNEFPTYELIHTFCTDAVLELCRNSSMNTRWHSTFITQ